MDNRTIAKVVHDEGEIRQLWMVGVDEGQYRCRAWALSNEDFGWLAAWNRAQKTQARDVPEPPFLARPDGDKTFADLADAYEFFGTDDDAFLQTAAQAFLSLLDPMSYPDPSAPSGLD